VLLLATGLHLFGPARLTNTAYASTSIGYRADLQTYGLRASYHKAWFGYGPGNLADALNCSGLHAAPLQATCRQGYFFNSSHNVFLDRVLAVGWPGGVAFLLFVLTSLGKGLRAPGPARPMVYAALLIACYYLTNVTSVTLELLFWILLLSLGPTQTAVPHER
jgi:O-antigen ligase